MSTVIKVEHLSKYYRLGLIGGATLQEDFKRWVSKLRGKPDPTLPVTVEDHGNQRNGQIWALHDVNLEVKEGEILGIIGRNGAGKSTLLKILSKITAPTKGIVKIKGRIGSLLEVGTGFHPELTGRENIYLNGTILGMTRSEVTKKLDEIIEFAEMDKFIDTPVKRYSSGMTVRLAFAVAAHLDPEILLVDEVLAVGDVGFQRKCLGKIEDVAKLGRTVLFVSHNMPSIENLCSRVVIIGGGRVVADDVPTTAVQLYVGSIMKPPNVSISDRKDRSGQGRFRIVSIEVLDISGHSLNHVRTGQNVIFRFGFFSRIENISSLDFGFTVKNQYGIALFRNRTIESGISLPVPFPNNGFLDCHIPNFPLTAGLYNFGFRLVVDGVEEDYITGAYAAQIQVVEGDFYKTGKVTSHAPFVINHSWAVSSI